MAHERFSQALVRRGWGVALLSLVALFTMIGCEGLGEGDRNPPRPEWQPGVFHPPEAHLWRDFPSHVFRDQARFPRPELFFEEQRLVAEVDGERVVVSTVLYNGRPEPVTGTLHVTLAGLDGVALDTASAPFATVGYETVEVALDGLPDALDVPGLVAYNLHYEVVLDATAPDGAPVAIVGLRSLFEALRQLEIQILTAERHAAGEEASRASSSATPRGASRLRVRS
jgi:hypothetical protein